VDWSTLSDEELHEARQAAAVERTEVRLRQNAIEAEIEKRQLLAGASSRVRILLGGTIEPAGDVEEDQA